MDVLPGSVCLFYLQPTCNFDISRGPAATGSSNGASAVHTIKTGVFLISYITCFFPGCVGSSEASIWPGSISEEHDFHCISRRFDLIACIHTTTQCL